MQRRLFLFFMSSYLSLPQMGRAKSTSPRVTYKNQNILEFFFSTFKNKSFIERITLISEKLLNTPYAANQMIGSLRTQEELVINLEAIDCLSFIEYVVAISHSNNLNQFISFLIQTRYLNKKISFFERRHFFSDWLTGNPILAHDITCALSPHTISQSKILNRKSNVSLYLPGIPTKKRTVHYIPSSLVSNEVISQIQTGDMIGIYTPLIGLDVTHTGFAIWKNNTLLFRNASSLKKNEKVVDTILLEYLSNKSGIIVYRINY